MRSVRATTANLSACQRRPGQESSGPVASKLLRSLRLRLVERRRSPVLVNVRHRHLDRLLAARVRLQPSRGIYVVACTLETGLNGISLIFVSIRLGLEVGRILEGQHAGVLANLKERPVRTTIHGPLNVVAVASGPSR